MEQSSSGPETKGVVVERFVQSSESPLDQPARKVLRPISFTNYFGQQQVKENLVVFVRAAQKTDRMLDHIILHGPPGLGKTTLAKIVAKEMGRELYETRGPAIDRAGDLVGILTSLPKGAILFIDEIHRMNIKIEEVLYSAMEDFCLDVIIGQGAAARAIQVPIESFTLIGATTRLALVSKPLLDRFGIQERLEFYGIDALMGIVLRSAQILGIPVTEESAKVVAKRSRGTPRVANRLLKRVWDFSVAASHEEILPEYTEQVLERQGIDGLGLDRLDRRLLKIMNEQYRGGPVGIDALAATLNEDRATLEEVYEPYLVFSGLIARTPRGRVLTEKGHAHIKCTLASSSLF
jgi:holliday junction DNA helicase RuvB